MTAPLAGVSVLVARGMGMGAQQHLMAEGIEPVLTDLHTIDEAVEHFLAGTLVNNPRRLHDHGSHH
jgi:predicted Fe-Mo cluster-binding NifX family protein